jgi:acyl-protein synthetase, luxE
MTIDEFIQLKPYSLTRMEKAAAYTELLTARTVFHRNYCEPYGRLLKALGIPEKVAFSAETVPMLPVSVFKELSLKSVPEEAVFKMLTSSGTSGQRVSQIYLDAETAANQQQVLYRIIADFTGENRIPYLVLDTKKTLRDRKMFSARGAGILGFSLLASRTCYALDENMELDIPAVQNFLAEHRNEPVLAFGFTFIIYKHVIRVLEEKKIRLDIPNGILIHGGGWKNLITEAVSPEEFKARITATTGIARISNYYGMAEQTGCIYMECSEGHLHASIWSDVLFRRARDFSLCSVGEQGIVQVLSPLPGSYPGHSLLTEDTGELLGEDDCPCGRLGKYFSIIGRIPRAEVRGCSDTYEG